jgi:hypothetical protein
MLRGALALVVLPAVLGAAEMKIDHATVAGLNLRSMQAALESVGIATVYGGTHTNGSTEMAIASFPDGSYLELMAFVAGADAQQKDRQVWGKFLKGDAGPCAWAVYDNHLAAEVQRLRGAGITVSNLEKLGRQRPDGIHLEWEMADVGGGTRGSFFPFLIHDFTPREQRAFPRGTPTTSTFQGVGQVVIGVRNLDDAIARFRRAYPGPEPVQQVDTDFGARLALLSGLPIVLAEPLESGSWLAARVERFGEAPCAFVLAAARDGHYNTSSQTRWFGDDVSWFDSAKLGWRLGVAGVAGVRH